MLVCEEEQHRGTCHHIWSENLQIHVHSAALVSYVIYLQTYVHCIPFIMIRLIYLDILSWNQFVYVLYSS
jgi:hypothetical protein